MRNVRIDNEAGAQETLLRGKYHGLYIELKVGENKATALQKKWIEELTKQGYLAVVCYGWQTAAEQLIKYLELEERQVQNGNNN